MSAPAPLEIARAAERGIAAAPGADLYRGGAGVVLFRLELHRATGEAAYLAAARAGGEELAGAAESVAAPGLYDGLAGIAFALHETFLATGERRFFEAARRAVTRLAGGTADADVISGAAGVGLFLLHAASEMKSEEALAGAVAAGRRLLAAPPPAEPVRYPNFAHGTAGVGTFLAELFRATGEAAFRDAALAAAAELEAAADLSGGGFRLFHHEPGGESLFYLGWCHGPAGTARLFASLARATGEARWRERVRGCARAILASGIPEERPAGLWNNVGRCCGTAGIAAFLLDADRLVPDPAHRLLADRLAADALRRASREGDALSWVHAEHRVRPGALAAQPGWMQGGAGIGDLFLRLGGFPVIRWPDSPFDLSSAA